MPDCYGLDSSCANATCALYGSVCKNGATCVNNPAGQNGFKCACAPGYKGGICEYSKNFSLIF